jgi:hypothetical protein
MIEEISRKSSNKENIMNFLALKASNRLVQRFGRHSLLLNGAKRNLNVHEYVRNTIKS